jgi:hypothetical protein
LAVRCNVVVPLLAATQRSSASRLKMRGDAALPVIVPGAIATAHP